MVQAAAAGSSSTQRSAPQGPTGGGGSAAISRLSGGGADPYQGMAVDGDGHLSMEGDGFTASGTIGLVADIAGIFDPTPISDGIGGAMSLFRGDFLGAGLSVASMVPFLGDGLAKPAKLIRTIGENFPALAKFGKNAGKLDGFISTLKKLGPGLQSPATINRALGAMNKMSEAAGKAYSKYPQWQKAAEKLKLPTDGPISFVPPKNWNPKNPVKGPNGGYMDAFGNEWKKGPSRTDGQHFEWDVVPKSKDSGLAEFSRDGSHVNVSWDGVVTHR